MGNILDLAGIKNEKDQSINIFDLHGSREFSYVNPVKSCPALMINEQTVIGDLPMLVKFVCHTFKLTKLYPVEDRLIIDSLLDFVKHRMMVSVDRMTKLKTQR